MRTYDKYAKQTKKMRTLQQTLSFLQSINHGQPFRTQNMVLLPEFAQKDHEVQMEKNNQQFIMSRNRQPARKQTQDLESQQRKKMNKNRAIKRIMNTSLEILETSHQRSENVVGTMSSITELHIYLKQFNRLLDKIVTKEKQLETQIKNMTEKEEALLENVYRFTVIEDYRDLIECAFLKDKISKQTFEIMSDAFHNCLATIKGNDLKIFESVNPQGRFKTIKLFQIENVDYHTQPHIFTILTLTRDKSKQSQYLYIRFQSQKHQNKWDRAIYCSFMAKNMKNKQKLFEIQYPPEKQHISVEVDEAKRQKKDSYELDERNILNSIDEIEEQYNNFRSVDKMEGEIRVRKVSLGQDQLKPMNNVFDNLHMLLGSQHNQARQEDQKQLDSSVLSVYSQYLKNDNKEVSGNLKLSKDKSGSINDNIFLTPLSKNVVRKQKSQLEDVHSERKPKPENDQIINNSSIRLNKQYKFHDVSNLVGSEKESELIQSKQQAGSQRSDKQKSESKSRKQSIQDKFSQGLSAKKEKLLFNKSKKIFIHQNQLEYWDYDEQKKVMTEKKVIKVPLISLSKIKQNTLELIHENGKAISFIGNSQEMRDIYQWINLTQSQIRNNSGKKQAAQTQRKPKHSDQVSYLLMSDPKFSKTH